MGRAMNRRLVVASGTVAAVTFVAVVFGLIGAPQNPIVANDDIVTSNGVDELVVNILANDMFEGPVSLTLEADMPREFTGDWRIGEAKYNSTHLIYTPGREAPLSAIPATYTYTIQDRRGFSDNASVTIHIAPPVAVLESYGQDQTFTITAYSTDPISGRLLDDAGGVTYNFAGINSADSAPPGETITMPPTYRGLEFPILIYPRTTEIVARLDRPLDPGTYTYQFARADDADYAGSDAYTGTFTVLVLPPPEPEKVS